MVALLKRMGYFDGLVNVAKALTRQAAGLMETTKSFRSKLASTRDELKQDYTPEEIEDNLGDNDFANDFAEELFDKLTSLQKKCTEVAADCLNRKHAIDAALVGFNKEEEVELETQTNGGLNDKFYKIIDKCSNWFHTASVQLAARQNAFLALSIDKLQADKKELMMHAREPYGNTKDTLFDALDIIRDGQLAVESAEGRLNTYMTKMAKYLKKPIWKYQHKWSLKATHSC